MKYLKFENPCLFIKTSEIIAINITSESKNFNVIINLSNGNECIIKVQSHEIATDLFDKIIEQLTSQSENN